MHHRTFQEKSHQVIIPHFKSKTNLSIKQDISDITYSSVFKNIFLENISF